MSEERVPYGNTEGSSISLPSNGMAVCVLSAAGLHTTFTTSMAGVDVPVTSGNTTISWNVFADLVTPLDTERIDDEI